MRLNKTLATAASGLAFVCCASIASADVLFWSTQARPVEEAQAMRETVLQGAPSTVDYQPNEDGPWITRFQAEVQA
ncbi:MAG: carbohydrate ABC transporter substrate-binding protein, partial [Pseudomonadota bacterium]